MSLSLAQINRVVALANLLSQSQLDRVIAALNDERLHLGDGTLAVQDIVGLAGAAASDVANLLRQWQHSGSTAKELTASLATAQVALQQAKATQPHIQLVWTGPLEAGTQTRSTFLVLQELIATAKREIVIVGYTITEGAAPILVSLADARRRGVEVTIIANRAEQHVEVIRAHWPHGVSGPTVFTYPQPNDDHMAALHAKATIVDGRRLLLTSANLTYHGLGGNIELGALIEDDIASSMIKLIQLLIERQIVRPVAI